MVRLLHVPLENLKSFFCFEPIWKFQHANHAGIRLRLACSIRFAGCFEMAPRKKARAAPPAKDAPFSYMMTDAPAASHMSQVPQLQRDLCQCVEIFFHARHGVTGTDWKEANIVMDDSSSTILEGETCLQAGFLPEVQSNGEYPFPLGPGGTFIDVAQRAQKDPQWLLTESANLVHACGLSDSPDVTEFQENFVTAADTRLSLYIYFFPAFWFRVSTFFGYGQLFSGLCF